MTIPANKNSWINEFSTKDFMLIAGPCSAETEKQVLETAVELEKHSAVTVFRAGLWKPRTRPGSFEGIGSEGFKWLRRVRESTRLRLAVEVASPFHVEECLKNGVDIIWIGARTTSNPFSVQELAKSLSGTNASVLVKNPLHPDLNLWMGAIERLQQAGLKRIGVIHRGFYPYTASSLRNVPRWDLLIELKRLFPGLPVVVDPSHIAGNTELIADIAQRAIDLDVQGLMVEVHSRPEEALSDSGQQFSPKEFTEFLAGLIFRRSGGDGNDYNKQLKEFRSRIDVIDQQLVEFLSERMKVAREIGNFKCRHDITILQLKRWEEILKTRTGWARELGLPEEFTVKLLQHIHEEAIRVQSDIMNRCKDEGENNPG